MPAKARGGRKRSTAAPSRRASGGARSSSVSHAKSAEAITVAANEYVVRHYPIGFLGGDPRRLELPDRELWIVPIFLTSPGYGPVGEVGVVALDAGTRQVVGSTPRAEVVAAGRSLREAKRDDLEAAFHRARTV